jgi:hypothetical protein
MTRFARIFRLITGLSVVWIRNRGYISVMTSLNVLQVIGYPSNQYIKGTHPITPNHGCLLCYNIIRYLINNAFNMK